MSRTDVMAFIGPSRSRSVRLPNGDSWSNDNHIPNPRKGCCSDSMAGAYLSIWMCASTIRPIVQTLSKEHRSLETASTALNIDASNSKETFVHSSQKDNNTKECWRHFLSKSGQSFMQSLQCDAQDKKGEGLITLYYPFLIRCSSMWMFEKELQQLVLNLDRSSMMFPSQWDHFRFILRTLVY